MSSPLFIKLLVKDQMNISGGYYEICFNLNHIEYCGGDGSYIRTTNNKVYAIGINDQHKLIHAIGICKDNHEQDIENE